MKYLHTMVRVKNIDESLDFYCNKLGLNEVRRKESEKGRFTLVFLGADNSDDDTGLLELTYNWDSEEYTQGRNFGHLAYRVKNIYETCQRLMESGVVINRPPRDGHMAFVNHLMEFLSKFYRKVSICLLKSHGFLCKIMGVGKINTLYIKKFIHSLFF